jgi:hypothetical protein
VTLAAGGIALTPGAAQRIIQKYIIFIQCNDFSPVQRGTSLRGIGSADPRIQGKRSMPDVPGRNENTRTGGPGMERRETALPVQLRFENI